MSSSWKKKLVSITAVAAILLGSLEIASAFTFLKPYTGQVKIKFSNWEEENPAGPGNGNGLIDQQGEKLRGIAKISTIHANTPTNDLLWFDGKDGEELTVEFGDYVAANIVQSGSQFSISFTGGWMNVYLDNSSDFNAVYPGSGYNNGTLFISLQGTGGIMPTDNSATLHSIVDGLTSPFSGKGAGILTVIGGSGASLFGGVGAQVLQNSDIFAPDPMGSGWPIASEDPLIATYGCSGSIGDFVWSDLNNNGTQDAGEPGIAGVTVELYQGTTLMASTTTDNNGFYKFVALCAGSYIVKVPTTPTGMILTSPRSTNGNDGNGSDSNEPTGTTVLLAANDTSNQTVDFGYVPVQPSIKIIKKTNDTDNDAAPGINIPVGAAVTWTYDVTNTGNVALTNVTVTDDKIGAITCPKNTLAVGESMTCTAAGIAVAGQYTNMGTVTGTPPVGADVTASNPDNYFGSLPSIAIIKKTNDTDNDAAPGIYIPVGAAVTWTYDVTNTGNVALTNVTVTDDKIGAITCPKNTLAVGESMTCTAAGIAVAGQYTNTGTVKGTPPVGADVTASNPDNYFGSLPSIAIIKKTNGTDNDAAPGIYIPVGAAVTWTYDVTNTGNVALTNVTVTDDKIGAITCPKNTLAVGESMTCTAAGIAVAGQYTNTGTVKGTPPVGADVTASNPDNYYGQQQTVCLGDLVWNDIDHDGIQDNGEPGIPGVTVKLLDCNGNLVATTTTDASGYYKFCNLNPGAQYKIKFILPSGFVFSPQDQGANDAVDSDADKTTGMTVCITVGNADDLTWDAGMYKAAGCVYTQGYWKTHSKYGPAGPRDATWDLITPNDEDSMFFDTAKTWYEAFWINPAGNAYWILAHQYMAAYLNMLNGADVSAIQVALAHAKDLLDMYDTDMGAVTGAVKDDFITTAYFLDQYNNGLIGPPHCDDNEPKAKIGDFVWNDANKNGIQDSGESGVKGVIVKLFDCADNFVAQTTTDTYGKYSFSVLPGDYYVQFILPSGYIFAPKDQGSNDAKDSDADTTSGKTACTSLLPGEIDLTWDAGLVKQSKVTIGDFVWKDLDKDGIKDSGEPGIKDVVVTLYDCTGKFVATTMTNTNGYYYFTVVPGSYYVKFSLPLGYAFSPKDKGSDDTKDSDADPATGKTTCFSVSTQDDLTRDAGMYEVKSACTYTQGYWKTHSKYGPAPYDDTWAGVGEDSKFVCSSGKSWYDTFWYSPAGNAYYILAHQYEAAYLNGLNGADLTVVKTTMSEALTLLQKYCGGGSISSKDKSKMTSLADELDRYNNGLIGPGHCEDEKPLSCE